MRLRKHPRTSSDTILSQIRTCLETATEQPGLVKASVYQTEGYLRGVQGLDWELPTETRPSPEDTAASFLYDVRSGAIALRGRVKKGAEDCSETFRNGLLAAFPQAENKPFAGAMFRLWGRWLGSLSYAGDPTSLSFKTGLELGTIFKKEYEEGLAGNLAAFLLDKRLHLVRTTHFLRMRGWLLGRIESLRRDENPKSRECAEILDSNLASIILRALHNAGPDYAAQAVARLDPMLRALDGAIGNLSATEPEAAVYLRNNRSTIVTKALHSGDLDYGEDVSIALPGALKDFEKRLLAVDAAFPEKAKRLRSIKRTLVYRALTNGRLDHLRDDEKISSELFSKELQ